MEALLDGLSPARWLTWVQDNPWLAIGIGLPLAALILWRLIRGGVAVRRAVVNVVGIGLVVWGTLWFTDWVRPSLTAEQLFTPPVVGPQPVKVVYVTQKTIERTATYTGTVHPYERVVINARSSGFVENVTVYPGDHVRAGQGVYERISIGHRIEAQMRRHHDRRPFRYGRPLLRHEIGRIMPVKILLDKVQRLGRYVL